MNTVAVAVPHLIPAGPGASIVITGSTAALIPNTTSSADPRMIMGPGEPAQLLQADPGHYTREMALHLAPTGCGVNIVHPTNCNTHLMNAQGIYQVFRPDLEGEVSKDDFRPASEATTRCRHRGWSPRTWPNWCSSWPRTHLLGHMTGTSIPIDLSTMPCMAKWSGRRGRGRPTSKTSHFRERLGRSLCHAVVTERLVPDFSPWAGAGGPQVVCRIVRSSKSRQPASHNPGSPAASSNPGPAAMPDAVSPGLAFIGDRADFEGCDRTCDGCSWNTGTAAKTRRS